MVDVKKDIGENQTTLVLLSSTQYNDVVVDVVKQISGKKICYVTLNKTFSSLKELFQKNKVDLGHTIFIDAISKTIKDTPDQTDGCYFVSSPAAMTELAITIDKFLKHNFDYLIFDSLTNLLIYEKKAPVAKFVSSMVNKVRQSKTKAIFYALSVKEQDEMIRETGMFVDKVIEVK